MAQEDRKAIDYLELAARQAHENHAKIEVLNHLLEASERADRCPGWVSADRRASWDLLLGEAELDLGLFTRAAHRFGRAVEHLDRPLPRTGAELGVSLAREIALHGKLRLALSAPKPADRERALSAARCYSALAFIHYNNHELGRMLHATMAGANLAIGAGGDSAIHARMLAYLAIVAANVPGVDPEYYTSNALQMAERIGDAGELQEVLLTIGMYETGAAKYRDAVEHFQRSIQIARSMGEVRSWEVTLGCLANVYRLRCEMLLADDADRQVLRSGFDRNVPQTQIWGFFGRACTLARLNRFDELDELSNAFGRLLEDEDTLRQVSASNVVAHLLTRALLELHRGREPAAYQAIDRSIALLDSLGHLQVYMTCTISYLHDALMASWRRRGDSRLDGWFAKADRFVARCSRMFPSAIPQALLGRGNRELRRDRPAKAARYYEAALREARKHDNPYDQACAHDSLSRCEAVSREARAQHARACARLLHQLGLERPVSWTL
jgi:tetratricopeptide (TPR) repeat protein